MVGPLLDRTKKRALGTLEMYSCFQNTKDNDNKSIQAKLNFTTEDEVLFGQLLDIVSGALDTVENQQVIRRMIHHILVIYHIYRLLNNKK